MGITSLIVARRYRLRNPSEVRRQGFAGGKMSVTASEAVVLLPNRQSRV